MTQYCDRLLFQGLGHPVILYCFRV